jgi:hypothetical protein
MTFGQLAKTAQRRLFTFELRRGEYAAAAKDFGRRCRARRCAHITTGLFNMPGSADSNSGMRKEKNPAPRSLWWISLILGESGTGPGGNIA